MRKLFTRRPRAAIANPDVDPHRKPNPVYVFRPRPGGVVIERWGRAVYQGTVPQGVVAARRAKNRAASHSRRANRR